MKTITMLQALQRMERRWTPLTEGEYWWLVEMMLRDRTLRTKS